MEVLSLTLLRVTLTGRDLVGPGVRVGAQVNHVRAILPVASQWTSSPMPLQDRAVDGVSQAFSTEWLGCCPSQRA